MAFDGVIYRDNASPTGTKWGDTGKLADLTADEIDGNFWELYSRLLALEDNPPQAVSISNILVSGSQMTFQMSDASSFGPFTLPIASFQYRGDYVPGTHYFELDLVSVPNQGLFMVKIEHDGEDPFDPTAIDPDTSVAEYLLVFGENAYIYDVGFFYPGRPGTGIESDGYLAAHQFVRPVVLQAAAPGSSASLRIAPAAALSFPLLANGTAVGSIDFALGSIAGTFTLTADVPLATGDILSVSPPAAIDDTARDLTLTLLCTRVL